jgi:hypothetical protein
MTAKLARPKDKVIRTIATPQTQAIKITSKTGWLDAASRQVGKDNWLFWQVSVVHSGLTKKAEPPPTRDVNRDSGTDSANGGWLLVI